MNKGSLMKNVAVSVNGTDASFEDGQWGSSTVSGAGPARVQREVRDNARHVAILGVPIANLTMDDTVDVIDRYVKNGTFRHVATANVDFLLKATRDDELMEILQACELVLPDGMPLVWASRIMGTPLKERVTGSDLVPRLVELAARRNYSLFLLGAEEARSVAAAEWMKKQHPELRIAGRHSPPIAPLDEMDHEGMLSMINGSKADILLVAFGNPKQEKWLAMHRHRLKVPVCIGVGASLDFLSGGYSRAPKWMQESGLEWLHRAYVEPARLAHRYVSNLVGLARYLPLQLATTKFQLPQEGHATVARRDAGRAMVLEIDGNFTGHVVKSFEDEAMELLAEEWSLVLDLHATSYVGADALGCLVTLSGHTRKQRQELWLTGVSPSLRRVLKASRLGGHFRQAPRVADALRRLG
jgi:N-acetylglucosaminyldiphosphoundecaprenol N-acetyl-beta-D-mannosaminyltransferase